MVCACLCWFYQSLKLPGALTAHGHDPLGKLGAHRVPVLDGGVTIHTYHSPRTASPALPDLAP
eukprot:4653746-Prymnesium_polylepis.2